MGVKICGIPSDVTAGLSFEAAVTICGYPAPEYSSTLYLRGPDAIDLVGVGVGEVFTFSATAVETAAWAPGKYWFSLRVTDGTNVIEYGRGELEVLPDMTASDGGYDGRTPNEIALAAIEAVLANRASIDQERYRINNRELYRTPIGDLIKLRSYYASKVRQEKGCGGGFGRSILVRFS